MKKTVSIIIAALLLLAAVPAFAFTGYTEAPAEPEATLSSEPLFDVDLVRVNNEPEVSQTPWGETYNTWVPMGSDPAAAVGETVTYSVEYQIGSTIEGFDAEALNQIVIVAGFTGLEGIEIIDATGLEPNQTCDYEAGYCYPLPGYGNAAIEDGSLVVEPKLNSTVQIIVRGTVASEESEFVYVESIGQSTLPTHYSVGKVEKIEGGYYVYDKDFTAVQIRGMKFFTEGDLYDHYYVCLNDIDYIRSVGTKGVTYTRIDDPSVVFTEGTKFEALERGYNDVMNFFGFTDDDIKDVMTDSVFLDGAEPVMYIDSIDMFADGGEPVEPTDEPAPVEPTDEPAPVEPTDEPAPTDAPIVPAPPATGSMSLAVLGAAAALAGVGMIALRRKNDR
ncbi:MAG: hypothetical protein IKG85_05665 [Clostridia bacterium]|nr:hypothetical protein [Clostridia bacterium]